MIVIMNCSAQFINQPGGVDEDIEVGVPDEFAGWTELEQETYLQSEFDNWLNCQIDSGFSFSAA